MKIHIPAFVAMVAMTAVTAFGQYRQQAPQPQQGPQPHPAQQAPMYQQAPQYQQAQQYQQQQQQQQQYQQQQQQQYQQPQRNWRAPTVQASTLRTPKTQTPQAPTQQGNYSSVVEGGGSDCGTGSCNDQYCECDSQCGSGCGGGKCGSGCGGKFGERIRSGNRGGRRNQNQCDDYNPCCPQNYVSLYAGGASFNDINYSLGFTDPAGATQGIDAVLNQNNGWTVGAAVGRRLRRRLRGEFELAYRNATFEEGSILVNGVNNGTASLDGQMNEYRSMTNLLFDVNPDGRFNAYFGGGMGVGFFDLDAQEPGTPIAARLESSSWLYQAIFGISAKINQRASVFFDYRYSGTDQLEFNAASPDGGLSTHVDITSNNFIVGIRLNR